MNKNVFSYFFKVLSALTILFSCLACSVEMRIYNVGQANAIVLKSTDTNKVLVVDCGSSERNNSWQDSIIDFVGKNDITAIITHQHADHYAKLFEVFALTKIKRLIVAGETEFEKETPKMIKKTVSKTFKKFFNYNMLKRLIPIDTIFIPIQPVDNVSSFFKDILEPNIEVECLLPGVSLGTDPHKQNLVIKITCNKGTRNQRSILLPGDACGSLIEKIFENNPECFNDIDVVVFSHHGSNENDEYKLLDYF